MARRIQFRHALPVAQTILAAIFGGWGLWIRNSILSRPFWGDSTYWDSTARFHVWPWPLRFAVILNMPALVASGVVSLPVGYVWPKAAEIFWYLPTLVAVFFLWYWVGSWLDRTVRVEANRNRSSRGWTLVLAFAGVCAIAASRPYRVTSLANFELFGVLVWIAAAFGICFLRRPIGR